MEAGQRQALRSGQHTHRGPPRAAALPAPAAAWAPACGTEDSPAQLPIAKSGPCLPSEAPTQPGPESPQRSSPRPKGLP